MECSEYAECMVQIDSKKELEKLLKSTCEVFIMAVTKLTVEPMLSFITKVTAVRVASSVNPGRRLREQVLHSLLTSVNSSDIQQCLLLNVM